MNRATLLAALALPASTVAAQGLDLRLHGLPKWRPVIPGDQVQVQVWAVGLPNVGAAMNWTTPPGTGQPGTYQGFASTLLNVHASTGVWSGPTIPSPPFVAPPFANHGTVSGSNVNLINPGVGFNAPITSSSFLLWTGVWTAPQAVPASGVVELWTSFVPVGVPPLTGFEVQLNVPPLTLYVSHFISASGAYASFPMVPAPATGGVLMLACLLAARRRRIR